jgi:hypothetical protein
MSHQVSRVVAQDTTGGSPNGSSTTIIETDRALVTGPEFAADDLMIEGLVANEDHFMINLGPVVDEDLIRPEALHAEDDEEDDEEEPFSEFEIYGLNSSSNGRCCEIHPNGCGRDVVVGDFFRLKKTVLEFDYGPEEAVACVLIRTGRETCTVAFVPRALLDWEPIADHINKHAQVVELYQFSRNSHKRRKNHQNLGVAGCVFIDSIDQIE